MLRRRLAAVSATPCLVCLPRPRAAIVDRAAAATIIDGRRRAPSVVVGRRQSSSTM
jgi:hypothetical protein